MWQRFTEEARKTIFYAQEEAVKLGENYVSTEHILLGLVREPDPIAADILARLGVTIDAIRNEVVRQVARGPGRSGRDMQLTPRAKRVIDLTYDEARQLNNNHIGTEHLLLGLIREGEGLAARVLAKLGVSIDVARWEVASMQGRAVGERPQAQPVAVPMVSASGEEHTPPAASSQSQGDGMWQRFTERARKVVFYGQEEAGSRGENYVGTIHLLLGLVRENDNVASRVMADAGIDIQAVYKAAYNAAPLGSGRLGTDMQLTPGARRMIDMAYEEARALNNNYIGTEHILLALYRDEIEPAGPILRSTGVHVDNVRSAVRKLQQPGKDNPPPSPQTSLLAATIAYAQRIALLSGSTETTPSHLLLAVLRTDSGAGRRLLDRLGIDGKPLAEKLGAGLDLVAPVNADLPPLSAPSTAVLGHAANSAKTYFGEARASTDHLLLALATAEPSTSTVLQSAGFHSDAVVNEIRKMRDEEG